MHFFFFVKDIFKDKSKHQSVDNNLSFVDHLYNITIKWCHYFYIFIKTLREDEHTTRQTINQLKRTFRAVKWHLFQIKHLIHLNCKDVVGWTMPIDCNIVVSYGVHARSLEFSESTPEVAASQCAVFSLLPTHFWISHTSHVRRAPFDNLILFLLCVSYSNIYIINLRALVKFV